MRIQTMFADNIDRKINGVIKVMQTEEKVITQELSEYVITRELKKHFLTFFTDYADSFERPTIDTGVWISGFFGSGKSHFLKILSYLLANETVGGQSSVDRFRGKFADDPAMLRLLDSVARHPAETILFNIDQEGFSNKNNTAVMRVFAKMFYKHLGFYGDNLKVARMEGYVDFLGKADEFRRAFEARAGKPWIEVRRNFAFLGRYVVPVLMDVLGMSEDEAKAWFTNKNEEEFSIAQLVEDMKNYVDSKPEGFRLIFLADEVGQYIGTDTNLLLNLQSIIEKVSSDCAGRVWIICTGQEALDEIIRLRSDEFSKIQDRFGLRLSLSSSSVDEVIQKRILRKTAAADTLLGEVYRENESVLDNLFSFSGTVQDIRGFRSAEEFAEDYPFVPYQFLVMQKVFTEIRKHGNAGKNLSGGERSMLSGFKEAAQHIEEKDENALVPFYLFYDTVHTFLDSTIRRVVERCQRAADHGDGLTADDVHVLKLLYLIRYIDDIPSNAENITILMAGDIGMDKVAMREKVQASLQRLLRENYIGRTGDTYHFLTDEEQDVQKEITAAQVSPAAVIRRIGEIIRAEILTSPKVQYEHKMNFPFDTYVDGALVGSQSGGMRIQFYTAATAPEEKNGTRLMLTTSANREAAVVLGEGPYYETIRSVMQVRQFVQQKNMSQLPKSVQEIIGRYQEEASEEEKRGLSELETAISEGAFYVCGEEMKPSGKAADKIQQALQLLVGKVYSKISYIDYYIDSDDGIREILDSPAASLVEDTKNRDAMNEMADYLNTQRRLNQRVTMQDVQKKFSAIPYGWREIDIAAVAAQLLAAQRATLTYGGEPVSPSDRRVPDMLRRRGETGKAYLTERQMVNAKKLKDAAQFLKEYLDIMDVPDKEDDLVAFAAEGLRVRKEADERLLSLYAQQGRTWNYPGRPLLMKERDLLAGILLQERSHMAFVKALLQGKDDLLNTKEDLGEVKGFFQTQKPLYDRAVSLLNELEEDRANYLDGNETISAGMNEIRRITIVDRDRIRYREVPQLRPLMEAVETAFHKLLEEKRGYVRSLLTQCMEALHHAAGKNRKADSLMEEAARYYDRQKAAIMDSQSLTRLDGISMQIPNYRDRMIERIRMALAPKQELAAEKKTTAPVKAKKVRTYGRSSLFPVSVLTSQADIDRYTELVRKQLTDLLAQCDEVKIQ